MLQLSPSDRLARLRWSDEAPATLVDVANSADLSRFGRKLRKRLMNGGLVRSRPPKKASRRGWSLWSLPCFAWQSRPQALGELVAKWAAEGDVPAADAAREATAKAVEQIGQGTEADGSCAWLTTLLLTDLLCDAGCNLEPELFAEWWLTVAAAGEILCDVPAAPGPPDEPTGEDIPGPTEVIATGELRLTTGALTSDLHGMAELAAAGRETMLQVLELGTDTDGTPAARLMPDLAAWLAPCIRSMQCLQRGGVTPPDEASQERFAALIGFAGAQLHNDGQLGLSRDRAGDLQPAESDSTPGEVTRLWTDADILHEAARVAGLKADSRARRLIRDIRKGNTKAGSTKSGGGSARGLLPAVQSDWAATACLRSTWSSQADLVTATWNSRFPQLDLSTRGRSLWCGAWELEVLLGGERVELADSWDCSCWFSDRDGDFLELQQTFDDGLHIERQIYLSRQEHFLLLADCISGVDLAHIVCRSKLPQLIGVETALDDDTREMRFRSGRKQLARLIPGMLPDDRVHSAAGSFSTDEDDGRVVLETTSRGGLYAPLLIDWEPRRRRSLADWSRLTVTRENQILETADAAGCRMRLGNHQLLCYRSLTREAAARAVLGLHTRCETVIGRFPPTGEVQILVQVDPPENSASPSTE